MHPLSMILLAFAMSTDAFAVAVSQGATLHKPCFREALRTGVIFGVIESVTPLVGWALGLAAAQYITAWDHWIAFGVLAGLGLRMVYAGARPSDAGKDARPNRRSAWILAITACGTSIDALAVGVSLAFIDVDIVWTAAAIGLATLIMVTAGVMLGRLLGSMVGRWAEVLGGVVLIGIGAVILHKHLTAPIA